MAIQLPPSAQKAFSAFHRSVVRASGGRLLTGFKGEPMILLTTTGARTGKERTWPLTGLRDGDGWLVTPTNGGQAQHSAWFHNLVADPRARVADGRRTVAVRAQILQGTERDAAYARFVDYLPIYVDHARHAAEHDRIVPVVRLVPDPTAGADRPAR